MTARVAMLMFIVGTPICLVALIAIGHLGSAWSRRMVLDVHDARGTDDAPSVATPAMAAARAVPAATTADRREPVPTRPVATLVASVRPPRPVQVPWAPGDGLRNPTADGRAPGEATVRKRAWTSYATIADPALFGRANLDRLERGRPPLRFDPVHDRLEAMAVDVDELGRARLHWPDADASVDPFSVTR